MQPWLKRLFFSIGLISLISFNATASTLQNIDQIAPILSAKSPHLNPTVLKLALEAYNCASLSGMPRRPLLTIIDYSLPSAAKRMWVFDLSRNKLLFNNLVAHGQGSGDALSHYFSDRPETHASSIGLYLTENTYIGHDGFSLRLAGLDKGFNDTALSRDIVMHGASYVSDQMARAYNMIGRSWGCPAVPKPLAAPIINTIKEGSLIFAYYPNNKWLQSSRYLHCSANLAANHSNTKDV